MRLKTPTRIAPTVMLPMLLLCALLLPAIPGTAYSEDNAPLRLTLPQAIDLALKQNRSLKLAQLAVVDSGHKKEIARSAYFPHIKNESAVLHLTELAGVEFPTGAFGNPVATGPIPGHNVVVDQGSLTTYTSGTGLEQPLTQMFKIHASNLAATADINTARIQLDQAQDEVALKTRQLYYGLLIAQLKQEAATEELSASRVKAQESTDSVERGQALEVVALESNAAVLEARQTVLAQKLQTHDLMLTLNDLLGLPLSTQLQLDEDVSAASITLPSRAECIQIAQKESPDIRFLAAAIIDEVPRTCSSYISGFTVPGVQPGLNALISASWPAMSDARESVS